MGTEKSWTNEELKRAISILLGKCNNYKKLRTILYFMMS